MIAKLKFSTNFIEFNTIYLSLEIKGILLRILSPIPPIILRQPRDFQPEKQVYWRACSQRITLPW